jgi:hypothetical protein
MITFVVFLVMFVVTVLILARTTRHRRDVVQDETERVAQQTLPQIGEIAERAHTARFGRPPTNLPQPAGPRQAHVSWYPPTKKAAKHR